MRVIGLSGPAGAGKDTAAAMIQQHFHHAEILHLADPIREACRAIFGWSSPRLHDPELKNEVDELYGVSPRYAMQTLGSEWRDKINPDLWLIRADKEIAEMEELSDVQAFLIPDVRFNHEAEWVKEQGGAIFEVDCPDIQPVNPHRSEGGIDTRWIDAWIYNHADLDYMNDQVDALVDIFTNG